MGEKDGLYGQAAPNRRKCLHSALSYKRLERGHFIWPSIADGAVTISTAQMAYPIDGDDPLVLANHQWLRRKVTDGKPTGWVTMPCCPYISC
jgi:hypothetical protein